MRIRSVAAASPAMSATHSPVGPRSSPTFGMKWSAMYTPSQPATSSAQTSSTITSQGWDAFGQIDSFTSSSSSASRSVELRDLGGEPESVGAHVDASRYARVERVRQRLLEFVEGVDASPLATERNHDLVVVRVG